MDQTINPQTPFGLKDFVIKGGLIKPSINKLVFDGHEVHLEPQAMQVLVYLSKNAERAVSKQELLSEVWKGVIVSENVLSRCISLIRKALQDDPQDAEIIETISKSGYRLKVPVDSMQVAGHNKSKGSLPKILIGSLGLIGFLLVISTFMLRNSDQKSIFFPVPASVMEYQEWDPEISPDGKYLAFSWKGEKQKSYDVYLKLLGTESLVKLTNHQAWDLEPMFMPDGIHIAFYRSSSDPDVCGFYKVPVLGGPEVKLVNCIPGTRDEFDISDDGRWLVFSGKNQGRSHTLQLYDLQNGDINQVTYLPDHYMGDLEPRFSPNGSKVAFRRARNSIIMNLFLLDLETLEIEQISDRNSTIFGLDWLTDHEISFTNMNTGQYMLWRKDLISGDVTLMPVADYHLIKPRYSKPSGKLVYMKITDVINIWKQPLGDSAVKAEPWLTSNSIERSPSIAPDGTKVAFVSNRNGNFEIWLADLTGGNLRQLTKTGNHYVANPAWSYDGRQIVFDLYKEHSDIYMINSQGGVARQVTFRDSDDEIAYFSKNGEWIYFSSNRSGSWNIYKKKPEGDDVFQVTGNGGYGGTIDPDGEFIYYSKRDTTGIWKLSIESGTESWTGNASSLYWGNYVIAKNTGYAYFNNRITEVNLSDLTSYNYPILEGKSPMMSRVISIAPDQSFVLFSKIDVNDTDIMVVEGLDQLYQ